MPSIYAHYSFGQSVIARLDDESKEIISQNKKNFILGLQGPDFLFFYYPLRKNVVNQTGMDIHNQPAVQFLNRIPGIIRKKGFHSPEFAYLLGFVCHFLLDSACHPYVQNSVEKFSFPHNEIETEFDKYLLLKKGKNPYSYPLFNLIPIDGQIIKTLNTLYRGYPGITTSKINRALRMNQKIKQLFYTPTLARQNMIDLLLRTTGQYKQLQGYVMHRKSNPYAAVTNPQLFTLYRRAVEGAPQAILEFHRAILLKQPLSERFHRNFE